MITFPEFIIPATVFLCCLLTAFVGYGIYVARKGN